MSKTPDKARRKSTSSGIIVLDGIQVLSFSRTQKATASSSCEAELYALSGTCGEAILVGRLFEFLTSEQVRVEVRCDSSSARQWRQRSGVGRLKHVDVRLCQLQGWVRENVVKIGTVKTALNVADLNTKKLTYARRAFLMYFLSQVEYSEGGEVTYTGVDEYERHEQEKKLKAYVDSNQVKDLIRLIQVFSVIKPVTAAWTKESCSNPEPLSTDAMEEAKYSRFEVSMLVMVVLLVLPQAWAVVQKIRRVWNTLAVVGKAKIHSRSRNRVFHRESCRYVQGEPRNGSFLYLGREVALEQGYRPCFVCFPESKRTWKHRSLEEEVDDGEWELTESESTTSGSCTQVCSWCQERVCTRNKPGHQNCACSECIRAYSESQWRKSYDKVPEQEDHSWNEGGMRRRSTQGPSGQKGTGSLEYMPPRVYGKGSRRGGKRGRAAVEGRIEPAIPEQNEEQPQESFAQENTPEAVYEDKYDAMYDGVEPGTPDSTEARTEGPPLF